MHVGKLTDQEILELACKYGAQARLWRQRFAGLLPEINRRKLFEKKGCNSIFEFANKLACISEEQTRNVLNLDRQFQDFPLFHKMLVSGEISINKLIRVCSVLKKDNEEFWANQVKILSKSALETLLRDIKIIQNNPADEMAGNSGWNVENQNGLSEPKNGHSELPGQLEGKENELEQLATPGKIFQLNLAKDVTEEILELQQKGIDINQLLREFLKKREEEIKQEQQQISESVLQRSSGDSQTARMAERNVENKCIPGQNERPSDENSNLEVQKSRSLQNMNKSANSSAQAKTPSRYINVATRKLLTKKYGNKCSIQSCYKPAEEIHHTQRWALSQNHNPQFLAPLCKQHHQIAHSIDLNYQKSRRDHKLSWAV